MKRNADSQVLLRGKDITCAKDFIASVSESNTTVKFFDIKDEAICRMESQIPPKLQPLKNTMKIHQVLKLYTVLRILYYNI